jgi:hypothetical protein
MTAKILQFPLVRNREHRLQESLQKINTLIAEMKQTGRKYLLVAESPDTGKEELLFQTDDEREAYLQLHTEISRGADDCYVVSGYSEEYYKSLADKRSNV